MPKINIITCYTHTQPNTKTEIDHMAMWKIENGKISRRKSREKYRWS